MLFQYQKGYFRDQNQSTGTEIFIVLKKYFVKLNLGMLDTHGLK